MDTQNVILLIILIITVVLYSTSFINVTAVSMLMLLALYFNGMVKIDELFVNFINSSTLLVIFMFIISGALLKTGAAQKIGKMVLHGSVTEKNVVMRLMILSMILSAFFSNMATAVIVATLAISIEQSNQEYHLSKMVMGIGPGCILGGMLTIIGVSGNVMVKTVLENAGVGTVRFFDFGKIGLPLCVAGGIYMYLVGYRISPAYQNQKLNLQDNSEEDKTEKWKTVFTIILFMAFMIGFITESITKIPIHITAFLGVLVLFLFRIIDEKEAFSYIRWPSVIMFASLLTLGNAIAKSGMADYFANRLVELFNNRSSIFILMILFIGIVLLTQFMSNGATSAVFYPIGIALAEKLQVSPVAVLMMINVAAGASFATPMATPLNAYLMSVGECKFSDYVKTGVPLMVISMIISILLCPLIWRF